MRETLYPWIRAACERAGGDPAAAEMATVWAVACLEAERAGGTSVAAGPAELSLLRSQLPPALWSELRPGQPLSSDVLFVLYADRLQLARMYRLESQLGAMLCQRVAPPGREEEGQESLARMCAALGEDGHMPFWHAAWAGQGFQLITGGPGSGKTTRVATWLAVHAMRLARNGQAVAVARLVAPTGKAAARLQQALQAHAPAATRALREACEPAYAEAAGRIVAELIATSVQTVHKAVGYSSRALPGYRYERPWAPADVLVLDEASMLSADMAHWLLGAARYTRSVLWLGDADQLPPVEAGSVLRDLTRVLMAQPADSEHVHLRLQQVRRYDPAGPVAALAESVLAGQAREPVLPAGHREQVHLQVLEAQAMHEALQCWLELRSDWLATYRTLPVDMQLERSAEWRILTPVHDGPLGAHALNRMMAGRMGAESEAYAGCPTLVTRNLSTHGLANGDVGVQFGQGPDMWVRFAGADAPADVPLHVLGKHWMPAWAMTMHKAQGSEFQDVLVVLPPGLRDEAISRELLYTAITRVRSLGYAHASLTILATAHSWSQALQVREVRMTGLAQLLDGFLG